MINPMYKTIPMPFQEVAYRHMPSIKSVLAEIKETQDWFRGYMHNKWVQEIKRNHKRNKRKQRNCRRKGL
jgi:hypothetical protein